MKINPELARIHAHLCGDGSVYIYKTKEKDRNVRAVIGYYNKNQNLLNKFRKDFNKIFKVKMKMRKNKDVYVASLRIFNQLRDNFGEFGSRKWRIPSIIKNASKKIKIEWLKSFFEDEAYHEKRYNRLKIKSVNYLGLSDAKDLLASLDILSSFTGPNKDNSWYLTIPNFSNINPLSSFKKEPIRKKTFKKTAHLK